jgi:hypothetical protein
MWRSAGAPPSAAHVPGPHDVPPGVGFQPRLALSGQPGVRCAADAPNLLTALAKASAAPFATPLGPGQPKGGRRRDSRASDPDALPSSASLMNLLCSAGGVQGGAPAADVTALVTGALLTAFDRDPGRGAGAVRPLLLAARLATAPACEAVSPGGVARGAQPAARGKRARGARDSGSAAEPTPALRLLLPAVCGAAGQLDSAPLAAALLSVRPRQGGP